jgi:dihydroorotase
MKLAFETKVYRKLLTNLHQRMKAGEQIESVPFELFRLHVKITDQSTNFMTKHISELQKSITDLRIVQNLTTQKLDRAVRALEASVERLDKQHSVGVWTGHKLN